MLCIEQSGERKYFLQTLVEYENELHFGTI